MTRTIGIRAILISAILVSMVWANPVPQVSACVCDVDGPRQSLATYSKAVVGRSVARADAEVIFDVSYSYGVEVPEMIVISRSMCDGDFGDSTGFVLQISDEDWDRVICSSTPGLTMDSLAEDIGLERFEPLPLEHALRLGARPDLTRSPDGRFGSNIAFLKNSKAEDWLTGIAIVGIIAAFFVARRAWRNKSNA